MALSRRRFLVDALAAAGCAGAAAGCAGAAAAWALAPDPAVEAPRTTPSCAPSPPPFHYPGARVVREVKGLTFLETDDSFEDVVAWYEARTAGYMEAHTPDHKLWGPPPGGRNGYFLEVLRRKPVEIKVQREIVDDAAPTLDGDVAY